MAELELGSTMKVCVGGATLMSEASAAAAQFADPNTEPDPDPNSALDLALAQFTLYLEL